MPRSVTVEGVVEHALMGWCDHCTATHPVVRLRLESAEEALVLNAAVRINRGERIRATDCRRACAETGEHVLLPGRLEILGKDGTPIFVWLAQAL